MTEKERVFLRNPDFIYRKIIEELILVPIHQNVADMNCIYTLNEVGATVWEALESPTSIPQLEELVLQTYEAELPQVQKDVAEFLNDLLSIQAVSEL